MVAASDAGIINTNGDVATISNTNNVVSNKQPVITLEHSGASHKNGKDDPTNPMKGPVAQIDQKASAASATLLNINSQLNNNGLESVSEATPKKLMIKVGNTTVGEACQLTKHTFKQLIDYYPQHCLPVSEDTTDR